MAPSKRKNVVSAPSSSTGGNVGAPVFFVVVPLADGTYAVEASDGGSADFLLNFRTEDEAEAWIARLKGMTN